MVQSPGLNQVLTLSGVLFCSISDGFIFGQMSGMLADLQSKNSTVQPRLDEDDVSWIGASVHVTAVCGFAIATAVTEVLGRRRAIIILSVPIIFTWIAMFFATDKTTLLITRLVIGASFGGVLQLSFIVTGEYFSPNVRSLYLNLISSVGPSIGTALGHVLGILLHWRTVALIGIIPTGLSALLPCLWQESPSWLASKGKFDECEKSFRALHVQNDSSERELELLIESEKNKITIRGKGKRQNIVALLRRKDLQNVTEFGFMISVFRVAAGKILFSTYAITMLQDLTTEDDILLVTLLVDGFAILGSCLSCLFVSRMRVRTLFLSTAAAANVILFASSICICLGPKNVYFSWFIAVMLALYFIMVNCGPYPVVEALIGEIYPLDLKTYCFFIFGSMSAVSMFLSTNLASAMFATIGYHWVFFVNACIMLLCYFYFWVKMPETKGRTLQEIEYFFKHKTFEGLDNGEQNRTLVKRLNE